MVYESGEGARHTEAARDEPSSPHTGQERAASVPSRHCVLGLAGRKVTTLL